MATKTTRKTAKTIRNLRGTLVHLRLFNDQNDKPYRIELKPRGRYGDVHTVPASLIDSNTFVQGVDVLFEIITKTEASKIQYDKGGYQGIEPARVYREAETVIKTVPDMDSSGKLPPRQLGPTYVDALGSDTARHETLRENPALPEGAFPPAKVVKG